MFRIFSEQQNEHQKRTMAVRMSVSGALALLVFTTLTCSATSAQDDNNLADAVTKLTEQLTKMSDKQTQQDNELRELSTKQTNQQASLNDINDKLNSAKGTSSSGPTFVRWGRRTCDGANSKTIYTGVAGGTFTGHSGGASNLLCLPRDPTFANYDEINNPGDNVVIAEYKLQSDNNFPFEHNDPLLLDNDVPCAVCEVTNGSSVMMIPGRVDCYSEWRMEYRGYLTSENWNTYRTEFVCVDASPEVDYSGAGPAEFSLGLYPAEAACPSLPCPPYGDVWQISCVVCSK